MRLDACDTLLKLSRDGPLVLPAPALAAPRRRECIEERLVIVVVVEQKEQCQLSNKVMGV